MADLEAQITALWEHRDDLDRGHVREPKPRCACASAIDLLDSRRGPGGRAGRRRGRRAPVAEAGDPAAVPAHPHEHDRARPVRVPGQDPAEAATTRRPACGSCPGAQARWGSYLAPGVIMMPSYVNIGAYVGDDTMVDTWATVGSCAQIGKNVHLSGGVGIGGVLEPPGAVPIMVGDDSVHRLALHGRRRRPGRQRRGARRGLDPVRHDPGDRRRDRRGDRRAASCPTGASRCRRPGRGRSPAASSACRACSSSSA